MSQIIVRGEENSNKIYLSADIQLQVKDDLYQTPGVYFNTLSRSWCVPHYSLPFIISTLSGNMFSDITSNELGKRNYKTTTDYFNYLQEIKNGSADIDSIIGDIDVKASFYPHQRSGLAYLIASSGVALVGDEMGVGKCLESISYAVWLKANRNITKVLVVCPNSIKHSVWVKEIKKWTNETFTVIEGSKEEKLKTISNCKTFFLITNYESVQVRSKTKKEGGEVIKLLPDKKVFQSFLNWNPELLILDEAHFIKSRTAKQTRSVKQFKSPYRLLLTGTPILNKVDEIWSLLNFLRPDLWNNYSLFCETYCLFQDKYYHGPKKRPVRVVSGYKNLEKLKREIAPIFIQRFKKDVLKDLPEKIYEDRFIPLTKEQVRVYNDLVKDFKTIIEGKEVKITKQLIIVQLTKLLQVCDTLACLGGHDISSKLDEVDSIISDMSGHKVVIFSWYRATGIALEQRLVDKKISVVRIDGNTPMADRTKYVDAFQESIDPRVFIATISSCGLGLTLTAADVCIFVSRCYVPGINKQAEDRLHRPGQKNAVNIINLYSEDTVDNRVKEILEIKEGLFDAFTKEDLMKEVKV